MVDTARALIADIPTPSAPVWSRDATALAYLWDDGAGWEVWVINAAGQNARRLASGALLDRMDWTLDGEVLFTSRSPSGTSISAVHAETGEQRRITTGSSDRSPRCSPDGMSIAFLSGRAGHVDVWLVPTAGGAATQLTEATNPLDEPRWAPVWSPDNRWVAYVSSRSGQRNNDDLWVVSREGREHRQLTTGLIVNDVPAWSPQGDTLAVIATTEREHWYGDDSDLWLVSMHDLDASCLTSGGGVAHPRLGGGPAWSSDAGFLYCLTHANGDTNLSSVRLSDGLQTRVTNMAGAVGDFDLSPLGRSFAVVSSTQTTPPEIAILAVDGGLPVPVTSAASRLSATLVNPIRMPFRTFDGVYCDAWLYLPPGFTGLSGTPALVQVHGGGTNSHGNGWHPIEHYLAQRGFIVYAIEYRGSSGYGRNFAGLSYGDWGVGQSLDAAAAARFLLDRSYVSNVGIYGSSYGGYLTLHALVQSPATFAAAADLYGITNRIDYFERSDRVGRLFVTRDYGGRGPADAPERYLTASTHHRLHEIQTPLLVLHGAEDTRVPPVQSEAVITSLKENNVACEHVVYPGEGHGFRRREHRIDAYERVAAWFDRYLNEAESGSEGSLGEDLSDNGRVEGA